ncbi:MAG: DUF4212 domain-containing protein [Planctomycetota bacterium]
MTSQHPPKPEDSAEEPKGFDAKGYWKANLKVVSVLLLIWFAVSFGVSILGAKTLNEFKLPGTEFPLGFWFAQQGSIYTFVVLIFIYVFAMNRIEKRFGVSED